jgi:uncharacterized protein
MEPLEQYSIPIESLNEGVHIYDFEIGQAFFAEFPDSAIQKGTFKAQVTFDKRPNLSQLDFDIEGSVPAECYRCLGEFDLPVSTLQTLTVKYDEEEREEDDLLYIARGTSRLNVARFIYEFIHLALPMIRTHELADQDCDPEILEHLDASTPEEIEAPEEEQENPIWEELKKFRQ